MTDELMQSQAAAAPQRGNAASRITPYDADTFPSARTRIDAIVLDKLAQLNIAPARLCKDEVFVRRVFLDAIGTLPTADEVRAYLHDPSPNKRAALIDRLLAREEFADYWALKWSDILRIKSEFPIDLWPLAAESFHRYIRTCLAANMPYDRFVRSMLTASGSNFFDPQVNVYRAVATKSPEAIAQAIALTFLGMRADKWPKDRVANMAVFFSMIGYKPTGTWKEEMVHFDTVKAASWVSSGKPMVGVCPDGASIRLLPDHDPRELFADWLVSAKNPMFTRAIVNRMWSWVLGRGIIQEPDDIRPDNPPQNPALLDYLATELVSSGFDVKHVFRLILNSDMYRVSSVPISPADASAQNFAHYALRRLDAEVLIDALDQITGTTETYSNAAPEPFTWIPETQRSICLADGSITSSFLEMFGRPGRDTGLESERKNRSTPEQRLHMLNSSHIQRKIERGPVIPAMVDPAYVMDAEISAHAIADDLYLTILSRYPSDAERAHLNAYRQGDGRSARTSGVDIAWALINSAEFLYKH